MKAGAFQRFALAAAIAATTTVGCAAPAQSRAAAGSLDPTFGDRSTVVTRFGDSLAIASAIALQRDGHLVVAGEANGTAGTAFVLARYRPDGTLDPTFGTAGTTTTDMPPGSTWAGPQAVAVQPDGKIVAAGNVMPPSGHVSTIALARYRPDGSLDPAFGPDGRVVTDRPDGALEVHGLALQPDGKVVVTGAFSPDRAPGGDRPTGFDFFVARYQPNGALDPTFGAGGMVFHDHDGNMDIATGQVLRPDGTIVAVGWSDPTDANGMAETLLVAFRPDGSLDTRFGNQGVSTAGLFGTVNAATVDVAGGIVVAGTGTGWAGQVSDDFLVARFLPDGWLDPSFGRNGRTSTDIGTNDDARGVAVLEDGSILAAGASDDAGQPEGTRQFTLAKYTRDGRPDTHFGEGGTVTTLVNGASSQALALTLQPDGRAVAAGWVSVPPEPRRDENDGWQCCLAFALARYDVSR